MSAACLAIDMARTFTSIWISLIVGINSSIPSNKLRLRDVIVSIPEGIHPEVI